MAARESKQREGLIVEIKPRVEHFAVEIDDRRNGAVGADEISGEEIERVLRGVAPRPVPAKPASLAIGEGLPRDAARAMRPRQRLAVEIDRLAEPAIDAVSPDLPPQRQRDVEQPAPQRRGLAGEIAHATQSLRACGIAVCTAEQVIPGTGERKIPCPTSAFARALHRRASARSWIGVARTGRAKKTRRKERPVSEGAAIRFMCRYASRCAEGR